MWTPAVLAASRMDVPAGTVTCRPSTVIVIVVGGAAVGAVMAFYVRCPMSDIRCPPYASRHRRHGMHRSLLDQRFEIPAELVDARHDRRRARVAEHADRLACHVVGDTEQRVEVLRASLACRNALEDPGRPRGAFAALGALRTALVSEESC